MNIKKNIKLAGINYSGKTTIVLNFLSRKFFKYFRSFENSSITKRQTLIFLDTPNKAEEKDILAVVSRTTRRKVNRVSLSTVVSKYVGETEKNLNDIFSKADQKELILFFDEADSLFGKRTEIKNTHDRYSNVETDYLLKHIKSFQGMVILTENRSNRLDKGFSPNVIIRFPHITTKVRTAFWNLRKPFYPAIKYNH